MFSFIDKFSTWLITAIMVNTKENGIKKVKVVKKVNVPATIRQIPHGETARFSRQELGSENAVRSAVWRENSRLPYPEYILELVDSGMYYDISRK